MKIKPDEEIIRNYIKNCDENKINEILNSINKEYKKLIFKFRIFENLSYYEIQQKLINEFSINIKYNSIPNLFHMTAKLIIKNFRLEEGVV